MISVHLDAVGGIAGDMFVAAMLDAFPEHEARVLSEGAAVLPEGIGTLRLEQGKSGGIHAVRLRMDPGERAEQPSGHYADMMRLIAAAPIREDTKHHAGAILTVLGRAEAAVHRVPLDHVHFHEIADWDSLVDVVCAGSAIAAAGATEWTVSDLPRGGGLVQTAHGLLPVPAPASVEILTGFRWRDDGVGGERVTPTGAAILRHLVGRVGGVCSGQLLASGTGAGTRELTGLPNVLRVLVFAGAESSGKDRVLVLEFDIDDMSGEEIGVASERLRSAEGVIDLSLGSRWGKKGRPVTEFRLLVRPEAAEATIALCFDETSTLGLRWREESRRTLSRQADVVLGVSVKRAERPGGATIKAESDAVADIATLAMRRAAKSKAERGDG